MNRKNPQARASFHKLRSSEARLAARSLSLSERSELAKIADITICFICCEVRELRVTSMECNHQACKTCIGDTIQTKTYRGGGGELGVPCPFECDKMLDWSVMEDCAHPQQWKWLVDNMVKESFQDRGEEPYWCPECDVAFISDHLDKCPEFTCPHCGKRLCYQCKQECVQGEVHSCIRSNVNYDCYDDSWPRLGQEDGANHCRFERDQESQLYRALEKYQLLREWEARLHRCEASLKLMSKYYIPCFCLGPLLLPFVGIGLTIWTICSLFRTVTSAYFFMDDGFSCTKSDRVGWGAVCEVILLRILSLIMLLYIACFMVAAVLAAYPACLVGLFSIVYLVIPATVLYIGGVSNAPIFLENNFPNFSYYWFS